MKIAFPLSDPGGLHAETLSAETVGAGRHRIGNVPFYVRNLSYGDEVAVREVDGQYVFDRILKKSGNGTLRVFSKAGFFDGDGQSIVSELQRRGFSFEFLAGSLAAGNIPAQFDELDWLEDYLEKFVDEELFYEISDW